tara:strand:- start:3426 stop:4943 length:1518 start_codon:yes stop_codon:yes gene_type:complete
MSDFLKSLLDKNTGSQTGEFIGAYLSNRNKKDNRARNVLLASLFFNAKEANMQGKVQKNLEELERQKTLEVAKLNNQWTKRVNLSNQYENIQKNGALNYYRADAEKAFEDAHTQEKELMSLQGGDIAKYKLDWMTDYSDKQNNEFMQTYNKLDKSITTKEEFTKPYMDYYLAQQNKIASPANVSLVHKAFSKIGIGKDKEEYADKVEKLKLQREANQTRIKGFTQDEIARIDKQRGKVGKLKISNADLSTLLTQSGLAEAGPDSLRLRKGVREEWIAGNMTYEAATEAIASYQEGFNSKLNLLKLKDTEETYKELKPEPADKLSLEWNTWDRGLKSAKRKVLGIEDLTQDTIDKANSIFDLQVAINNGKDKGIDVNELEKQREEFLQDYVEEVRRKAVGDVSMATVQAEIMTSRMARVYEKLDSGDLTADDIMINALDIDKLPSDIQENIKGLNLQEINSNEEVLGDSLSLFRELQTEEFIRQQFKLAKIFSEQAIDDDPLGLKK